MVLNNLPTLIFTCSLHGRESFLRSQPVFSQSRNSPHFMEPEGSLPLLQVPSTCPYPESDRPNPYPPSHFLKIHLTTILPSTPGSCKLSLSLRFPYQIPPLTPIRAICPAHCIALVLITRMVFGKQYRSLIFSLSSLLVSPLNSSLLAPVLSSAPYSQTSLSYVPHSM